MPRQKLPIDLGDDAPTHKVCPDCFAEGRDPYILPIDRFYIKRVPNSRYKGGYRISSYCIEHEKIRVATRARERYQRLRAEEARTGVTPPALEELRRRGRRRRWTAAQRAKARAYSRLRYWNNRDQARAQYRAWAAKNAEKRKAYRAEWYQRVGKERERLRKGPVWFGRRRRAPHPTPKPPDQGET